MATYQKNGLRKAKLAENALVKKHVKAYNKILLDMKVIADKLQDCSVELNEENINEYVLPIYGRELDSMEKMLVLGKIFYKNESQNNAE